MRLVDARGRLWGRWNLIDVSVGLLAAAMVSFGVVAAHVTLGRWRQHPMLYRILPVDLLVTFTGVDEATAKQIRVGDVERNAEGRELARIEEILEVAPETLVVRFGDRDWIKRIPNPTSGLWDVSVRLRIMAELHGDSLFYKGNGLTSRLMASSASLGFHTPAYTLRGMVYDEGWLTFTVVSTPMPLTQAKRLRSGQTDVTYGDKLIARLIRIDGIRPPGLVVPQEPPTALLLPNAQQAESKNKSRRHKKKEATIAVDASPAVASEPLVSVTLHLEVLCQFKNGQLLFKNRPATAMGPLLSFNFDGVSFEASITNISAFKTAELSSEVPGN